MQIPLGPSSTKRDNKKQEGQIPPLFKGERGDPPFLLSFLFILLFFFSSSNLNAESWSGYFAVEGRYFLNDPLLSEQREQEVSIAGQPEFYQEWEATSLTIAPFFRIDSADSERSHFDLRELFVLWYPGDIEVGIGIRKIFWGVTESQHLVDIINQTDLVEFPDAEEKLGQPMVNLSILKAWGTLDFFILPYFRERTFPGPKGRLRSALVVDTDQARFESGAKNTRLDAAIRYSQSFGDWDIGLSHFKGTNREPTFLLGSDGAGKPVLIPFYQQIDQSGLDLQHIMDVWLLKLEVIHRSGQGPSFQAWTAGFEYTFTGIFDSKADLGVLGEWLYDSRGKIARTPFEDDIMFGLRLALNDMDDSALLLGMIQDLDQSAKLLTIEGSRRFGEHWQASLEGFIFMQQDQNDLLFTQRDDDFFQMTLAYYF